MPQKTKRFRKGDLETQELARYPIIAAGNGLPDKDAVYAFPSKRAFNDWAKGTRFAHEISHANKLASQARKYEKEDNRAVRKRQRAVVDRITNELKALSRRTGLDVRSKELLLKATVQADPLEGPVFDSAVLYKDAHYRGAFLPLRRSAHPNLRWFNFNDCVSSVAVTREWSLLLPFGLAVLYEYTWFRGAMLVLCTEGFFGPNLADLGRWNDKASSVVVV